MSNKVALSFHFIIANEISYSNYQLKWQVTGPILRIVNAMVRDRGVYTCTAENPAGIAQASAAVEVKRKFLMTILKNMSITKE